MDVSGLVEPAYAKVNLYLHVTAKRADGYHLLKSLFVFCDASDEVRASPADIFSLQVAGPFAHYLTGDNLVLKATRLLAEKTGVRMGAALTLTKNLPVAAGIGGGSADAAATLRLLVRLWKLEIEDAALHTIALQLGADVPACLSARPQLVEGIGDVLAFAPRLPDAWLVLVHPAAALMTAEVFKEFKGPFVDTTHPVTGFGSAQEMADFLKTRYNALQLPAMRLQPHIKETIEMLSEQNGCLLARMSGSGATCFGIFPTQEMAELAAQNAQRKHPSWWVKAARLRT